jgi:hypothetical protein
VGLGPSHRILGARSIGPFSNLNNTAHNEPHALTIDRPDRSSGDQPIEGVDAIFIAS